MAVLLIGLMSGTSIDGIETTLVHLSSPSPQIIATHVHNYPGNLQQHMAKAVKLDDPLPADLSGVRAVNWIA